MAGEQIRITGGPAAGQQIDIAQELQVGRSAGAEGRLGDDPEISRQHARFSRNAQGQLVVEDLGSTNGTYVNGQRISGQQVLNAGDTVQMGRSSMTIEGGAGGQATAIGAVPAPVAGPGAPPPPPAAPPTAQTQPLPAQGQGPGAPPPPGPGGPAFGAGPGGPGGPGGPAKKNTGRIAAIAGLIAAVIIGAVVLALVLSGGDDEKKDPTTQASTAQSSTPTTTTTTTPTTPTTTETTPPTTEPDTGGGGGGGDALEDIPPATKRQFVKQCSSGGSATRAQCQCAINKLDQEYDFIEFIEILGKVQRTGKFPPKAQRLIRSCA